MSMTFEEKQLSTMENPEEGRKKSGTVEKDTMEQTFVLCYPVCVNFKLTGNILMKLEENSLSIKRIRLVCVTEKFLAQYFSMDGRNIFPVAPTASAFCPHPFIAVEVEGPNAISVVHHQLIKEPGLHAYSSNSARSVEEDCGLWFGTDSADWIKEAKRDYQLVCALPGGDTFGPVDTVMQKLLKGGRLRCKRFNEDTAFTDFYENFYTGDLTFVLIKPQAVKERCVGQLLSVIESKGFSIRGMNTVTNNMMDFIDHEGDGIALIVEFIDLEAIQIKETCGDDAHIFVHEVTGIVEICSDLIHLGKPGDMTMIGDYFKCGVVSWVDSSTGASCGGYFLDTLSSLEF